MPKPIFILNGPNLNLLGAREPQIYGHQTLGDVENACAARASALGATIDFRQTNHEGDFITWLHEARTIARAVIVNPGAWTHTSVALLDALKALDIPSIEVHLSNPAQRESFRHVSFAALAVKGSIAGLGAMGYLLAIEAAVTLSGGPGG